MRIAILGANGQLGSALCQVLGGHDVSPLTRDDFDVCDRNAAEKRLKDIRPRAIVNTTAFHKVDLCETRRRSAFAVNAVAPFTLAAIANEIHATLVHISTDYVLSGDGSGPLTEDALPNPSSVYASSKLAGEYVVRNVAERHIVIRTCGLYGHARSSGTAANFVEAILRRARAGEPLRVVDDQIGTPTWAHDLARQMVVMLDAELQGLFHASAQGACSWYEFAKTVLETAGVSADLTPVSTAEYNSPARRPAYAVLENARLQSLGLDRMLHWTEGLSHYLAEKERVGAPDTSS